MALDQVTGLQTGRYNPYPQYVQSDAAWVDRLPNHWCSKRLRFVIQSNPVKSAARSLPGDTAVSFVPMESVGENGGLDLSTTKQLDSVLSGYTYFCDDDVLVAKITPCFENGKGAIAEHLENGIGFGTTELHVLRATDQIFNRFLFYITLSDHFRRIGESEMYGAGGQKRVPEDFIRNLRHPLPPLAEQWAIAAFLDRETGKIDTLIAKKERLIALLQEKRTALITHAVTKGLDPNAPLKDSGVEWLGHIPAHWEEHKMAYVAEMTSGGTPNKDNLEYWNGDIPWVSPKDMKTRQIADTIDHVTCDALRDTNLELIAPPAVLIVVRGMILAHTFPVAYTTTPVTINQDMKALRLSENLNHIFFVYLLEGASRFVLSLIEEAGHGTKRLRTDLWRGIKLYLPPVHEQKRIAATLDTESASVDYLIGAVQKAIDRLKEYRTALISAAVTGKIDVRNEIRPIS